LTHVRSRPFPSRRRSATNGVNGFIATS